MQWDAFTVAAANAYCQLMRRISVLRMREVF
jgi:hypothetical protein